MSDNKQHIEIIKRIKSLYLPDEKDRGFSIRCGIPQTTFSGYVTGKRAISIENALLVARANDVSLDWLITGEEPTMAQESRPQREQKNPKDPFDLALDTFFEKVKEWQGAENGRTMETAMEFTQDFPLRYPEYVDWLKKRGGDRDMDRLQERPRNSGNGKG